jgi:ATP synthase I chain
VQPAGVPLVDAAANLRRSAIVAGVLGLASIVLASFLGHPLMGVFAFIGLALGAGNNWMLQRAVQRYGADPSGAKARFSTRVFLRLGAITLIAIGFALLIRPDGLGIFVGLAVFQVLMLVGSALPVFRSLRAT